jgi:hypothetical protein
MLFAWGCIASFAHWDSYVKQIGNMHPFHIHVHDALPSLLPHHVVRNAVVVIRARSPFIVSGALHGLDGEKAKVPGTPRIIPSVGSKPSLWFSSMV